MVFDATAARRRLEVAGVTLDIAYARRRGEGTPIVFLHGFGSTKEDYLDVVRRADFAGRPVLAYDAPGCGETRCDDLSALSIPFLVETAQAVLAAEEIDRFHLVGHSMGGLTGLMVAHAEPQRVASFVDIEGNLAPEDAFLSRQIVDYADPDPEAFFAAFIERVWRAPGAASALYAASLRHKVRADAVRGIFASMVALSDEGALMDKFLGLPAPRMLMHGAENAGLSYLASLEDAGVTVCSVPECGHFPMYSNAPFMWRAIGSFVAAAEAATPSV